MSEMSFTPIDELPKIDDVLEIELDNLNFMSLPEFFEKYNDYFQNKTGKNKGKTNYKKVDIGFDMYNVWMNACLGKYGETYQNLIARGVVGFEEFFEGNWDNLKGKPKKERFMDFYWSTGDYPHTRPLNYYYISNGKKMLYFL